MAYFNAADGKPERIGKVIGDLFAAALVLSLIVILAVDIAGH